MKDKIARLEHEQWIVWTKHFIWILEGSKNNINYLMKKFTPYWVDYDALDEPFKAANLRWAEKTIKAAEAYQLKPNGANYESFKRLRSGLERYEALVNRFIEANEKVIPKAVFTLSNLSED